jgi:hypothetical protein
VISDVFDDMVALHCHVLYYLARNEHEDAFRAQMTVCFAINLIAFKCLASATFQQGNLDKGKGCQLVHSGFVQTL